MLIFCHLFVGIIIGLILAVLFKNKFAIIFGAVGGILPDLIDKPLGHIILADTIGNGRIYAHSAVFVCALFLLGIILFAVNREKIAVLCIAAGALSHQLLDTMWTQTDVWFWPFAGHFISDAGIQKIISVYQPVLILGAVELAVFGVCYLLFARKKSAQRKLAFAVFCLLFLFGSVLLLKMIITGTAILPAGSGYIEKMFVKEISSGSEWAFGIASLIMLMDVLFISTHPRRIQPFVLSIAAGVFCLIAGIAFPFAEFAGIRADAVYGASAPIAVICLIASGAAAVVFANFARKMPE